MANLDNLLCDFRKKYPGVLIFIRGDVNVNIKNTKRLELFQKFCNTFSLESSDISHPTYHHFLGDGKSDSQLDVLLHSSGTRDDLVQIICKHQDPTILSHHDIIVSRFLLHKTELHLSPQLPTAPRVLNDRVKIYWSDEGIDSYLMSIQGLLGNLRDRWLENDSESSFSVLLSSTYSILDKCARSTNRFVHLSSSFSPRSKRMPLYLVKSARYLRTCFKSLKKTAPSSAKHQVLSSKLKHLKQQHQRLIRFKRIEDDSRRDALLDGLNSGSSSSSVFSALRKLNRANTCNIQSLSVGTKTYHGDCVPDGIFNSIKDLKTEPIETVHSDDFPDFNEEYRLILEICSSNKKIPLFSYNDADKMLRSLKKNVNDFFSITPLHFLHAGIDGIEHFKLLMNAVINNINYAGISELNSIYACVLYKGNGKNKIKAKSYRTISTCPLIAKALDSHVRNLSVVDWNQAQALTQYQGHNMSHELAILLLTETIQFSLYTAKTPLYVLFLDARAAFDRTINSNLIRSMYLSGTDDLRLLYVNNRLENRHTFCEFNHHLMGPIADVRGLEQGGIFSSDVGVYILQMTRILFPGRTDPAPKIFTIEGNPTPPN